MIATPVRFGAFYRVNHIQDQYGEVEDMPYPYDRHDVMDNLVAVLRRTDQERTAIRDVFVGTPGVDKASGIPADFTSIRNNLILGLGTEDAERIRQLKISQTTPEQLGLDEKALQQLPQLDIKAHCSRDYGSPFVRVTGVRLTRN